VTTTTRASRPVDHPVLLARSAGITAGLFALCVGALWVRQEHWPVLFAAAAVGLLGLSAGQVFGAGRESDWLDLAATLILAAVWVAATGRAVAVGPAAIGREAAAVCALAAVVVAGVYAAVGVRQLAGVVRR
jgi:hypothetical protein